MIARLFRDPSFLGLLAVLLAATALPWALGGVAAWAYRPAGFVIFLGFSSVLWLGGFRTAGWRRSSAWLWPAAALAGVALVQCIPLPSAVVGTLSPRVQEAWSRSVAPPSGPEGIEATKSLENLAVAAVPEAASIAGPGAGDFPFSVPSAGSAVNPTVSYHPGGTFERLVWFLALLASFLITREATSTAPGLRAARFVLLANGSLLAATALAFRWARPGTIYGWIEPLRGGSPYGPYVNPSHFAFVMELVVPWLLALAWLGYRTVPNLRSRGVLLPGFLAIVCAAAALGSASKGAALLVPLSAGVILTAALRESRRKGRVLLVGAMGIALVAVALLATPVRTRVEDFIAAGGTDLSRSERFMVWKSSLPLLAEHPVLGIGFGAFRHVIPRVLPAGEPQPWLQLHNDFLEVVVSGGGVAAVLLVALILGYARRALAALRSGSPESLERFGALVGVGAVSAHALFDFGHQIPANALLFVVTAAVGVPRTDASGKRRAGTMPARFLAVALAAVSLAYTVRGTYAGLEFSRGMTDAARGEFQSAAYRLERAGLGGNGFEAAWAHGDVLMGVWDRMQVEDANSGSGADVLEKAAQRFLSSEREVAASGWPFQGLGSLYRRVERAEGGGRPFDLSWIGESPWAAVGRRGRIAIGLHRLAVQREPMVSAHHDALIVSLIELGLRQEAKEALRQAARLQPILVQHNGLDPSTIVDDFLEAFHRGAVEALSSVPMTPPQRHLLSLGQTAFRLRRYDEAESWLKKALVAPADRISRAEARVWLAYTAARQGRFDQAGQWFESTLDVPNFRGASLEGLARLANDRGDVEEELRLRDELRKENPGDSGQLVRFADAAVRAGNAPMAVQALRTASLRRPHDTDLQVSLASALLAAGDREGASAVIRQIEGLAPGDSRIPDLRRRLRSVEEDAEGRP